MNAVEIQKAAAGARGEQARTLRSQGLLLREIAAELGVARTTVGQYLADPDGARLKARRDGYRGRCECGSPTHGTNAPGRRPRVASNAPAKAATSRGTGRQNESCRSCKRGLESYDERRGRARRQLEERPSH